MNSADDMIDTVLAAAIWGPESVKADGSMYIVHCALHAVCMFFSSRVYTPFPEGMCLSLK